MSIYYADLRNGNDSDDGLTPSTPKLTLHEATALVTAATDEVRVRGTDGWSSTLGGDWTWVNGSSSITATGDYHSSTYAGSIIYKDTDDIPHPYEVASSSYDSGTNITTTVLAFRNGAYSGESETTGLRRLYIYNYSPVNQNIDSDAPYTGDALDYENRVLPLISFGWDSGYTSNTDGYTIIKPTSSNVGTGIYGKKYWRYENLILWDTQYGVRDSQYCDFSNVVTVKCQYGFYNSGTYTYLHDVVSMGNTSLSSYAMNNSSYSYTENVDMYNHYSAISNAGNIVIIYATITNSTYGGLLSENCYIKSLIGNYLQSYILSVKTSIIDTITSYNTSTIFGGDSNVVTAKHVNANDVSNCWLVDNIYTSKDNNITVDATDNVTKLLMSFGRDDIIYNKSDTSFSMDSSYLQFDSTILKYQYAITYSDLTKDDIYKSYVQTMAQVYENGKSYIAQPGGYAELSDESTIALHYRLTSSFPVYLSFFSYQFEANYGYKITLRAKTSGNLDFSLNVLANNSEYVGSWTTETLDSYYDDYEFTIPAQSYDYYGKLVGTIDSTSQYVVYIDKITIEKI